jgi:hypothetical protein
MTSDDWNARTCLRERVMRSAFLTVAILLLHCHLLGCNGRRNELLNRLQGTWQVDLGATEPELAKVVAEAKQRSPEIDAERIHQLKMDGYRARRIVVTETTFTDHRSGGVQEERGYSVLRSGKDFLILRQYDDERYPQYSAMSLQEIVAQGIVSQGPVPFCIGIDFIDEDHFVLFTLRIRNHEMTYERKYATPIFKRVHETTQVNAETDRAPELGGNGKDTPTSPPD